MITCFLFIILDIMVPSAYTENSTFHDIVNYNQCILDSNTTMQKESIIGYFTKAKISNSQEKVFEITNAYLKKYSK